MIEFCVSGFLVPQLPFIFVPPCKNPVVLLFLLVNRMRISMKLGHIEMLRIAQNVQMCLKITRAFLRQIKLFQYLLVLLDMMLSPPFSEGEALEIGNKKMKVSGKCFSDVKLTCIGIAQLHKIMHNSIKFYDITITVDPLVIL